MRKGWIIVGLVVAVVAGVAVWAKLRPEATVEVVRARVETIRAYVEEQAVTELPRDTLIAMEIAGWLEPITLREGDEVKQGDVVARLETEDLKDRVVQAEQRIEVLKSQIEEVEDHRLEQNALIQSKATVEAILETVRASEAKLEASLALVEFTQSEVGRLQKLTERSAATDKELREAELAYRQADAEYKSDRLELAALKTIAAVAPIGPKFIVDYIDRKKFTKQQREKELVEATTQLEIERRNAARAEMRSPIDGVVLTVHQRRRQYLAAGTPVVTLGRLDEMEVIAEVLTERATRIAKGDRVEIFGEALEDGPIEGTVSRVYPAGFEEISSLGVEQQRVKVAVKPSRRPALLGVGFRVYVRIIHDEAADAVTLPRTCLFRGDDGGWQVMVVEDGKTALQPVELGLLNEERAQVISGVDGMAAVVARPSRELEPGTRVAIDE